MKRCRLSLLALLMGAACTDRPMPVSVQRPERSLSSPIAVRPADYVATPAGWYHRSCVHEIPTGARIDNNNGVTRSDGSRHQIPGCLYASYGTAHDSSSGRTSASPKILFDLNFPVNPTVPEYAYMSFNPSDNIASLSGVLMVPSDPVGNYSGRTFYTYQQLGTPDQGTLLQPVLQYGNNGLFGGSYWTIAAWWCDGSGCSYSTPRTVIAGDQVEFGMGYVNCNLGCQWDIGLDDVSRSISTHLVHALTTPMTWVAGAVVKTEGFNNCNQYPLGGGVEYQVVHVARYLSQITPAFVGAVNPNYQGPSCSYATSIQNGSQYATVDLWFTAPPPPPLTVWISAQPPYYYAEPSGGYTPYTYLWEWCAIDCGGAWAPMARAVGPNTVARGWQFLSTDSSVYWTMPQSILRLTVTDYHNHQAVDTYNLP